ncbi:MAG: hypothetical protein RIQ94_273 [Pseudomonadota bacterium]|jgi:Flp pilus assembly protein TadG
MNMTLTPLRKEKGVVLVLVALGLVVLMGMAALAIDLSHAEVNKTRLQNLADALALSAAISLNKGSTDTAAQAYAITNTLPKFLAALGNNELNSTNANLTADNLRFTFATNAIYQQGDYDYGIWVAANNSKANTFVRVTMINPMSIPTWFARVFSTTPNDMFDKMTVSASAVAGTAPIAPCDNILPILACAEVGNTDTDCSDGACYGYATNTVFCFKTGSVIASPNCPAVSASYSGGTQAIPGNFGWMDVSTGGKGVNDCAAGDPICAADFCANFTNAGQLKSQTGTIASINQGFNTRFDLYQGAYKSPSKGTTYYPDTIVGDIAGVSTIADNSTRSDGASLTPAGSSVIIQPISATAAPQTNLYLNYSATPPPFADAKAADLPKPKRRVLAAPFIKCENVTKNGGKFTVPASDVVGFGCLFITEPMPNGGDQNLYAEVIDNTNGACLAAGKSVSNIKTDIYKVILYKDPFGGHS